MPIPSTGTVTFLFTDIEGSTRLAQQFPAAWPAVPARHHAIVRSAIESHGGHVEWHAANRDEEAYAELIAPPEHWRLQYAVAVVSAGANGGAVVNDGTRVLDNAAIQCSQTDINHGGSAIFTNGPVYIENSLRRKYSSGSGVALLAQNSARVQPLRAEHRAVRGRDICLRGWECGDQRSGGRVLHLGFPVQRCYDHRCR